MMDQTNDKPNLALELALLLALSTLGGASYSFIKVGVETIPPVTLIAARTAIAAAVLIGVICWRGAALPKDAATWRRRIAGLRRHHPCSGEPSHRAPLGAVAVAGIGAGPSRPCDLAACSLASSP
jgi:drug/metabolite transporter (DMT)-like permease